MKRKRITKRTANALHTKKRAKERYAVVINKREHKRLVMAIRTGSAKFVKRQSNSRTLWLVTSSGIVMLAVYSKEQGNIVTILPFP